MPMQSGPFFETFSCLPDPRSEVNKKHLMIDMLFIALCGVLCGLRGWEEVADFAKARKEWFKKYLELPNGIPSHDAIRYLFVFIDQKALSDQRTLNFLNTNPRYSVPSVGPTRLFSSLTANFRRLSRKLRMLVFTRSPARQLLTKMMKSSAYLTKLRPRFSNSLAKSSSMIFANNGESGPP